MRAVSVDPLAALAMGPETPMGSALDADEDGDSLGEAAALPQAQALQHLAEIEESLNQLSTILPETRIVTQDFLLMLRQIVPQALAAMMSGAPLAAPPAGALGQLAGMAPGMGAGMGMSPAAPTAAPIPGAVLGAGGPGSGLGA